MGSSLQPPITLSHSFHIAFDILLLQIYRNGHFNINTFTYRKYILFLIQVYFAASVVLLFAWTFCCCYFYMSKGCVYFFHRCWAHSSLMTHVCFCLLTQQKRRRPKKASKGCLHLSVYEESQTFCSVILITIKAAGCVWNKPGRVMKTQCLSESPQFRGLMIAVWLVPRRRRVYTRS